MRVKESLGTTLLALSVSTQASYWPQADTAGWSCRLCPEQAKLEGSVSAGSVGVSESSDKFGEFTGLDESGAHLIVGADLAYRTEQGALLKLELEDAGLDAPRLALGYGKPGRYQLSLDYERLPKFVAEDAQTVFQGSGTQNLTLPQDWQTASSTRAMTGLLPNLHDLPLGSDRETIGLGVQAQSGGRWHYGVDYKRIEQDGEKLQGASFLTNAAVLPVRLDRVTDQVDANLSYLSDDWQIQLAYHGSLFDNRAEFMVWENPFTPLGASSLEGGPDRGQLSQEPDNRFHQLLLSGHWQPLAMLQTSARVALGRAEQDETFLPATINPAIGEVPQPAADLDGQVDTFNSHGRALLTPFKSLTLTGEAYYDERDNKTDLLLMNPVRSDLALAPARLNRPFSFERTGAKLRLDYQPKSFLGLTAGASREETERDFQETEETSTTDYWGEVRASSERLELRLRYLMEDRRFVENHRPLEDLDPPENPLLRRFHLGERDRNQAQARLSYTPLERVSVSFSLDYAEDDYNNTQIGLTRAEDLSQSIDLSASPKDDVSVYAFFTRQVIESEQAGSENFSVPDWTAQLEDTIYTAGFGLEWFNLIKDLDLGLDFSHSNGRGEMQVINRSNAPDFPNQSSDFNRLEIYSRYRLNDNLSLRLDYWYEKLSTDDFFIDNVQPNTIPNLLSLGQQSPNYSVHAVGVSASYRF